MNIYFGPNGHGKSTFLENEIIKEIKEEHGQESIFFMPSEIIDEDEVKDTIDSSLTMEYILSEILSDDDVLESENAHREIVRNALEDKQNDFNEIIYNILELNNQKRNKSKNFITPGKLEYKKLVSIDRKMMSDKMGSGQKRLFLLSLVNKSEKQHIVLDEPEQHLHKSLLHKLAEVIRNLKSSGKEVYIVTHSSELMSLLDIDLNEDKIYLFNDYDNYRGKKVDLSTISSLKATPWYGNLGQRHKSYYVKEDLNVLIRDQLSYDFYKALFSKKVYIVEGINDELFLKKLLISKGQEYGDYSIFKTHGKFIMPVFCEIFSNLGITVKVMFDLDSTKALTDSKHNLVNEYLLQYDNLSFEENIEKYLDFNDKHNTIDYIDRLNSFNDWSDLEFKEKVI